MTVLSVVQQASTRMGIKRPELVFGASDRTSYALQDTVNEVAKMVAFDTGNDWTALKRSATFPGDGVALGFAMPADYKRMLKKADVWCGTQRLTHYSDTNEWLALAARGFLPATGAWTLIGSMMEIRKGGATSPLASGETVQFPYLSNEIVRKPNAAGFAEGFTTDEDQYVLDERLLRLALIYRWKQDREQDYAEAMSDYQDALAQVVGADKGSRILTIGQPRLSGDATFAFPYPVGQD